MAFNPNGIFYDTYSPTQLRAQSFADTILKRFPNGTAPLFAMIGEANKKKAIATEHGYFTKSMSFSKPIISAVIAANVTTITMNTTEGMIPNQVYQNTRTRENLKVISVTNTTTIEAVRGYGRVAAAATTATDELIQVGNSQARASLRPTSRSIATVYVPNYTTIFRDAWALSDTDRNTQANAGYNNVAETQGDCLLFHSLSAESALLWGQAVAPTGNPPTHSTQGVIDAIYQYASGNVLTAGSTTSYNQLVSLLEPAFTTSSNLSDPNFRVVLCDSLAMRVFQQIGKASASIQQMMTDKETSFGMNYTQFITYKGKLAIKEHPLFSSMRTPTGFALVLDIPTIGVAYLGDRNAKAETYTGTKDGTNGGIDASGGSLTTEFAVETTSPQTCCIINGLTAGVA